MEKMAYLRSFKTPGKIRLSPELISLVLILLVGFFLRIYKIRDYIIFLGDEGRDALVVYEILHGNFTLLGPTSSVGGFFLGPVYYYLMAPFLFLSKYDPVGPAVMVVLFGIATIYLVYQLGKEFFGIKAGMITAFLYAISPIVIIYSRASWNPNVFPFFTISSLYTLYKAVSKNKASLFVLSGFLMGINLQIHYLATFAGAVMFFYVLFVDFAPNSKWFIEIIKRYLLMFSGFLIGFSPFILFELRHSFTNSQNIVQFIFNSSDTGAGGQVISQIEHVFTRLFGGLILSFPLFSNFKNYDLNVINVWQITSIVLGLTATAFFTGLFIKTYKNRENRQKYFLILVWGVVGIGLFALYKKSIYDYYLGFLFPLPFLLVGLLLSSVMDKFKIYGKIFAAMLVIILVLINLKFTPITMPRNKQVDQVRGIAHFVLDKTEGKPYNFALSGIGNSDHGYRYFFKLAGRDPVVIKGIGEDPERKSVTDQLFIICEVLPCSPLGESSNDIAGFGRGQIAGEWNVSVIKVYKIIHYTGQ